MLPLLQKYYQAEIWCTSTCCRISVWYQLQTARRIYCFITMFFSDQLVGLCPASEVTHISHPPKPLRPTLRRDCVTDDLSTSTHVFTHQDAVHKPLQPPYNGSYPGKHTDKSCTININGKHDTCHWIALPEAHLLGLPIVDTNCHCCDSYNSFWNNNTSYTWKVITMPTSI